MMASVIDFALTPIFLLLGCPFFVIAPFTSTDRPTCLTRQYRTTA